ncbi:MULTISPECIES: SpoIIE family protein phosphatase [Frankia]|uniref:Regulatory protein n=1 Tax=Frankia alni (strain DSM 45986 / CECT 9034 / ACN14a) TaxID=326424 RepID=Q0RG97_FRAAA|nr:MULTISPECIES: SpoIIE family protein phosphatase [Frankia]CAJ63492.1 putative regulatory protein [Frankia alni ACN14a]
MGLRAGRAVRALRGRWPGRSRPGDPRYLADAVAGRTTAGHTAPAGPAVVRPTAEVADLSLTLAGAGIGVWSWEPASGRLVCDEQAAALCGLAPGEFDGTIDAALATVHPEDVADVRTTLSDAARTAGAVLEEYRILRPDGSIRWIQARGAVVRDGTDGAARMVGLVGDVSSVQTDRDGGGPGSTALWRAARLLDLTHAIGQALTVDELGDVVVHTAAADLGIVFAAVMLHGEDGELYRSIVHPETSPVLAMWQALPIRGPAAAADVVRDRRPRYHRSRAEYLADYPDRVQTVRVLGLNASAHLPLVVSGRLIGVLVLVWNLPRDFDPGDQAFLQTLAGICAHALERARLYERQTTLVAVLQRAILPQRLPDPVGVRLSARYLPASRDVGIGGDWYDAIVLPDGALMVVVGDVGGHGLGAIAIMAELHQATRAYALQGRSPAEITTQLAANLAGQGDETLATAVVAHLTPGERWLTWSCAGHPPPLLIAGSSTRYLEQVHGPILGAVPGHQYGQSELSLPPGCRLLLYSDGLVERRGASLSLGLDAFAAAASAGAASGPGADGQPGRGGGLEDLCDGILTEITTPAGRDDDVCLLAVGLD